MSQLSKRSRSLVITVMAIAATNIAISFASDQKFSKGNPAIASMKSGVPTLPDFPRP